MFPRHQSLSVCPRATIRLNVHVVLTTESKKESRVIFRVPLLLRAGTFCPPTTYIEYTYTILSPLNPTL